jgi:hypothetical protein
MFHQENELELRRQAFAAKIVDMGKRGESAYPVDGATTIDIPAQACRGRAGNLGRTFTGFQNLSTGIIRFDCADDSSFWLEVDLNKVPAYNFAPGQAGALAAASEYKSAASRSNGEDCRTEAVVRGVRGGE